MSERVAKVLRRIVDRRSERLIESGNALGCRPAEAQSSAVHKSGVRVLAADSAGAAFVKAVRAQSGNAIIAEVKMGSPKLGDLRSSVDPEAQAKVYRAGGAAALSVVVEPDHFFGSYQLLERCRTTSGLPAIAKDFVVSAQQFVWARDAGANAVLLIAALYEPAELVDYALAALDLGLVPLIETHTAGDVAKLHEQNLVRFELVGVNNRDLRDFSVDLENSIRLRPTLPAGAVAVAESGIHDRGDIERLSSAGFDAFLIGESLLLADDPGRQLAALLGEDCAVGREASA